MCCLMCFDDSPIPDDPKAFRPNTFQISMMEACYKNQPVCLVAYLCPPCCAYSTRMNVLDKDISRYTCCQGYLNNRCFTAGQCGEQNCPKFCLAVESCCCLGPSMSSSRMFMMDQYDLRPDPCDNRIVRFTNCLMLLSCVCDILAIFIREIRHLAHIIHMVANCVFYTTIGCMASQVHNELANRAEGGTTYASLLESQGQDEPQPYRSSQHSHRHGMPIPVGQPVPEYIPKTEQPRSDTADL